MTFNRELLLAFETKNTWKDIHCDLFPLDDQWRNWIRMTHSFSPYFPLMIRAEFSLWSMGISVCHSKQQVSYI